MSPNEGIITQTTNNYEPQHGSAQRKENGSFVRFQKERPAVGDRRPLVLGDDLGVVVVVVTLPFLLQKQRMFAVT